jgi:hypothetical protein
VFQLYVFLNKFDEMSVNKIWSQKLEMICDSSDSEQAEQLHLTDNKK